MGVYSAADVIGKTLFAKRTVKLLRSSDNLDAAKPFDAVPAGQIVGTVYSYIAPKPGKNKYLYWMFYDGANVPYFARHEEGAYDLAAIKAQGVKSYEEKEQEQKARVFSWSDFASGTINKILLLGAGLFVAKQVIDSTLKHGNH